MVFEHTENNIMKEENPGGVRIHDHRLRLKQRFEIVRKLGQGACGKVQLGLNKKTAQQVAIKIIKKCKIEKEEDLVRIRREVQIMSSVKHPNIVHIYEVFENSEKIILVMEYCPGGELYDYLSERKRLEEDEARRIFRQIATAIYYCHKHKICHRDLKLENVLLDENGNAKIADFGLSNVFEEKRLLATFCGSPLYASPEIVKGIPYIGPEVDCWSLGVLLYTLVYGAMPFVGSNFKKLVTQISTGDYFRPKKPSPASDLIRDMLTVDPTQRADIVYICNDPWVNKDSDVNCMELAEALANETPVRLDLLLSLAPPPLNDKLVITDENTDDIPTRSKSLANMDTSAERRILEMVAEGGTDAIKPSPTRTIVSANDQPKRKLETTLSMDNAPSQRKKERFYSFRSNSKPMIDNYDDDGEGDDDGGITDNNNRDSCEMIRDISMDLEKAHSEQDDINLSEPPPPSQIQQSSSSPVDTNEEVVNSSEVPKLVKKETKSKDTVLKERNASCKPVKKKSLEDKDKVKVSKDKSPTNKNVENEVASKLLEKKTIQQDETKSSKPSNERRKSRILDTAEKLNSLSIQPSQNTSESTPSPPTTKPKRVMIPGVSVGSFKEQYERRASLTSGGIPTLQNESRKSTSKPTVPSNKTLADKKVHSVDSEHFEPSALINNNKESNTLTKEAPIVIETTEVKKPVITEVTRAIKPLLTKSESVREQPRENILTNNLSLDDARRSLQQSMDLLNRAKNDSKPEVEERQKQLKTAREIISNAISEDNNKKNTKISTSGRKPPVPYGSGGRSASGSISLSSMSSSPPMSPPHISRQITRESPVRTFRTEIQHRVDDVRNKFPSASSSRCSSVERIIPIHFADEASKTTTTTTTSSQLPYQRNNTMPYRLNSIPRASVVETEKEKSSIPLTPSKCEPIKKSPREYIIPIAVEGVGYVTPRQGSLEPSAASETPTKLSNIGFTTSFPKPRRISSLVSGGESDDEDDVHMHRLRSTKRNRTDTDKETVSSGEEDDDEGFEILTAENLFSTLLERVRNLTNRLNGEEGPGFQSVHHNSLFNNLHSPFFDSFNNAHLSRKHKRHNIVRDGSSWRHRNTSRDIAKEFDSMFHTPSLFPGGTSAKSKHNKYEPPDNTDTSPTSRSLDLSDLDLSKIELSEQEMATLSGLTPALSRRLQNQLLAYLPPAAARTLRRTLSVNSAPENQNKSIQHKYARSLSVEKSRGKSPQTENSLETHVEGSVSPNSLEQISEICRETTKREHDEEDHSNSTSYNSRKETSIQNNNHSESLNKYNKYESTSPNDLTTLDRSVLSKYFSRERSLESYPDTIHNEPSYIAAYPVRSVSPSPSAIPTCAPFNRRSLRIPGETSKRRVSRFLRPDFFDTPREESVYVREKIDKELETQKVLQEIRKKRNQSSSRGHSPCSPLDSAVAYDKYLNNSDHQNNNTCNVSVEKSRSTTPFYSILNDIKEDINTTTTTTTTTAVMQSHYNNISQTSCDNKDDKFIARTISFPVTPSPEKNITRTQIPQAKHAADRETKSPQTIDKDKSEDRDDNGNVTVSFNVNLPMRRFSKECQTLREDKVKNSPEKQTKKISPEKLNKNSPTEEKKKIGTKKKIVVKKKSTASKTESTPTVKINTMSKINSKSNVSSKDDPVSNNSSQLDEENKKSSPIKKKSMLQSIGQRLEKFRSESFSKSNQIQEKIDNPERKPSKSPSVEKPTSKPPKIVNAVRTLRESSVPIVNEIDKENECNIKRSATITDITNTSTTTTVNGKRSVQRVLGLFKKSLKLPEHQSNGECNTNNQVNNTKRPTSLLLNGARTSDSIDNTSSDIIDNKSNKRGLRLDFSRLPKFNQNIFNRRSSIERSADKQSNASLEASLEDILKRNAELSIGSECLTSPSDCDVSKYSLSECGDSTASPLHPHRMYENTSPDPENIEDRIRRRSFYSRFNEKKARRKSHIVGPGAKEYIPPPMRTSSNRDNDYNNYDQRKSNEKADDSDRIGLKYRSGYSNGTLSSSSSSSRLKSIVTDNNIPRYNRTISLFDNYEPSSVTVKSNPSRYGRTLSMLSPGNYATYNPRSHTRNSAILLRDCDNLTNTIRSKKVIPPSSNSAVHIEHNLRYDNDNEDVS